MHSEETIALSAAALAIAISGIVVAFRAAGNPTARLYLILTFSTFACIVSVPVGTAFIDSLFALHMPLVLPLLLALPPIIYHYILARTLDARPPSIHWRDKVLPTLGAMVTLGYWVLPFEKRHAMFILGEMPSGIAPLILAIATITLILAWCCSSLFYLLLSVRRLRSFRQNLKERYSNTDRRELHWIDWFAGFLGTLWAASALSLFSDNFGSGLPFPGEVVFILTALLLLFLLSFMMIEQPADDTEEIEDTPLSKSSTEEKYSRSALSQEHSQKLARRIEAAMKNDKLYLDANLSLQKLSRHIGALPNLVSQTLNEEIGSTFFDYVARWRIEAAKPLITSGETSVRAITLEVGFNSRSTFYKAFKRETGLTPNEFKDKSRLNEH